MEQSFLDVIARRRSCRRYQDRPLDERLIETVVNAGRQAPSGGNCQYNQFLIITNRDLLNRLAVNAQKAFARMEYDENTYKSLRSTIQRAKKDEDYVYHYNAPALIVVANRIGHGNGMADASTAMENMMLAATALGLGSCWINQTHWLRDEPSIRELLLQAGMDEGNTVYASMALGYSDEPPREGPELTGNRVVWVR